MKIHAVSYERYNQSQIDSIDHKELKVIENEMQKPVKVYNWHWIVYDESKQKQYLSIRIKCIKRQVNPLEMLYKWYRHVDHSQTIAHDLYSMSDIPLHCIDHHGCFRKNVNQSLNSQETPRSMPVRGIFDIRRLLCGW